MEGGFREGWHFGRIVRVLQEVMKVLDADGDGVITKTEFQQLQETSFAVKEPLLYSYIYYLLKNPPKQNV